MGCALHQMLQIVVQVVQANMQLQVLLSEGDPEQLAKFDGIAEGAARKLVRSGPQASRACFEAMVSVLRAKHRLNDKRNT